MIPNVHVSIMCDKNDKYYNRGRHCRFLALVSSRGQRFENCFLFWGYSCTCSFLFMYFKKLAHPASKRYWRHNELLISTEFKCCNDAFIFHAYMCSGLGKPVTLTKNYFHFYLRNGNLHYLHVLYCLLYSNIPTRSKVTGI